MKPRTEKKNYELLIKGDPAGLINIHLKYNRRIFWVGRQILDDDFVVESLVQDTFLKLWDNRESIEAPKHIYFFLRMVMKRECYSYYTMPRNKFFRKVNSLESYENYQDYLGGYDPKEDKEHLLNHEADQEAFDRIRNVFPLLRADRKRLLELCLKYSFKYKIISQIVGTSVNQTSNEVRMAIQDIKNILTHGNMLEAKQKPSLAFKVQGELTADQQKVLQLRCEMKYSFASIARQLNLSQTEVHKEFLVAYRFMQEKHEQQQLA